MTSSSLASKFFLGWNLDRPCWLYFKLYAAPQFLFLIWHGGNLEPLSLCWPAVYLLDFAVEMTNSSLASKFLLGWNLDRPCWLYSKLYTARHFLLLILHGGNSEPLSLCCSAVYLPKVAAEMLCYSLSSKFRWVLIRRHFGGYLLNSPFCSLSSKFPWGAIRRHFAVYLRSSVPLCSISSRFHCGDDKQ